MSRVTGLNVIHLSELIQDIQRFLDFLKRNDRFVHVHLWCDQQQELFDRLPEHCEVQWLVIHRALSDLGFLFSLKDFVHLRILYSIDAETISKVFEELPLLRGFYLEHNQEVRIQNAQ